MSTAHVFRRLVEQQQRQALLRAFPNRCLCGHPEHMHYRDRNGRPTCGFAVCGCAEFREDVR